MKNYKITWHHENNYATSDKWKKTPQKQSYSQCIILIDNMDTFTSTSKVHPNDNFDRKIGLYESFKKTVIQIQSKEDRKQSWNDFLSRRKPSRNKKH